MVESQDLTQEETIVPPCSSRTTQKPTTIIEIGKLTKATRQKSATHVKIQTHLRSRKTKLKTATTNGGEI